MKVERVTDHRRLVIDAPYEELSIMRSFPMRKWDRDIDRWIIPAVRANLAILHLHGIENPVQEREIPTVPDSSFLFKTMPMDHQMGALLKMRDQCAFALFMDPGTGKTKIFIDDSVASHRRQEITGVLLICPNSITSNWIDELAKHSGGDYLAMEHDPSKLKKIQAFIATKTSALKWLIMGVESLSSATGVKVAEAFIAAHVTELAVDESSRIKTFTATRTKSIIRLASMCPKRRIGTGTPATQGPQNIWSQFEALDPAIFDLDYYPFRALFCVMGGYKAKKIVAAKNEDILLDLMADHVFQARKKDCLNLPEKVYQRRFVEPSEEQARLYNGLLATGSLDTPNGVMDFDTALVRDLRLHQLTGGFVATQNTVQTLAQMIHDASAQVITPAASFAGSGKGEDVGDAILALLDEVPGKTWYSSEPIDGPNPKIEELKAIIEERDENAKVVIWCRYRAEVEAIARALEGYGKAVQFHGGIDKDGRTVARQSFQDDPTVRFFIGQINTGGIGITLTAASVMVYFSNDWSAENRIQSEDRIHRIGQGAECCEYIDILLNTRWMDLRVANAVQRGVDYHTAMMDELAQRLHAESGQGQKNYLTDTQTISTLVT